MHYLLPTIYYSLLTRALREESTWSTKRSAEAIDSRATPSFPRASLLFRSGCRHNACVQFGVDARRAAGFDRISVEVPCDQIGSNLVWSGLAWPGLAWLGLVWPGLVWSGLVWSGLH